MSEAPACRLAPSDYRWLNLLLDDGPPDIATLWELCLRFEYDKGTLVAGLRDWLGAPAGQRLLDCACGTGFPAIDLARHGYHITCSDGSPLMLGYFKRRADHDGLPVRASQVRWEDLADHFESSMDVVMCRGCALPYAGTWDDDAPPDRGALAASVREFAACLRPGGRLYVDTASAPDTDEPQVTVHPPVTVGSRVINLSERLSVDRERRLRFWQSRLVVDGQEHQFERRSHFLPPHDLIGLLADAGLAEVRQVSVPGEHYCVVTATRADR